MEREDSRNSRIGEEHEKKAATDTSNSPYSAGKASDGERTGDASDVVKDENIPVVYIDTTPDVPIK